VRNWVSKFLIIFSIVTFLSKCKVHYYPPVKPQKNHFLIVEGFIRSDSATTIKLNYSRVVSQYDSAREVPETNANVMVEDNHSNTYQLKESSPGIYTMDPVSFDSSYKYRVHIFTKTGEEYESDFVPFKKSPPIDSIDWASKFGGVEIYANTHNAQNSSRYYRWDYVETWEFHSPQVSGYVFDGNEVIPRTDSDQVHICWNADTSRNIILGTTKDISQDILHHQPLLFIEPGDIRLSVLYSIVVTQYALDSNAYNFWQTVKQNTQDLGSVFAAQPIQIGGNIHCLTDTSEKVIGFIGAGTISQKRIFISNSDLPPGWNPQYVCQPFLMSEGDMALWTKNNYYIGFKNADGTYTGYYYTCANCSLVGSTQKPPFWP
jgi:hypothetical protein